VGKSFTLKETVNQYLAEALKYWPSWTNINNLDTRWVNLHQIISRLHKECQVPRTILGISKSNKLEDNNQFDSFRWQLNMTWGGVATQNFSSEREAFIYAVESAYIAGCRVEAMWVDAILGLYDYRKENSPGSRRYVVSENTKQYFANELNMTYEKINRASEVACNQSVGLINDGNSRSAEFRSAIEYLRKTLQLKLTSTLQSTSIVDNASIETGGRARAKKNWQKLFASPVFRGKGKILNSGEGPNDRNDWLEVIAPHIPAAYLINAYAAWKGSKQILSFLPWLETVYIPSALYSGDTNRIKEASLIMDSKGYGVEYLDEQQRKGKIIRIQNGLFIDSSGKHYHTGVKSTMHSGNGWAVFVMDKNYTIYSDSHKSGTFHHSSFLSGGRVFSAGEIAVDRGKLVAITCKSGHYRPTKKEMVCFLDSLSKRGVDLKKIPIQLEWTKPTFYDAEQVLRNNADVITGMVLPGPSTPPLY
jgi:hypothetical protein